MANILHQKNDPYFVCKKCDFICSKKGDYNRHISTSKHKKNEMANNLSSHFTSITSNDKYVCECGREYKHRSSLSKHRQKCVFLIKQNINDNVKQCSITATSSYTSCIKEEKDDLSKDLIVKVLQENSNIKDILVKQYETMQNQQRALENQHQQLQELIPKVGNNNTVNNVKQKFNINIFLNEQCRDALNIDDFIKQINISLDSLEVTKTKGLGEGLSNLLIENINKLSVYERPLHCTDSKRETLYIKDNNVWEKDDGKTKIKSKLKDLSKIQYKNVKQWIDANPDYMDNPEKQEYFIDLVRRCSSNLEEIDSKVIKKVCNNVNLRDNILDD
tara:strand:- start:6046 stop:7041 length:996 start_codon:yes stop_codon:yes gene_type:complete